MVKIPSRSGLLSPRVLVAFTLFVASISVGVISLAGKPKHEANETSVKRLTPPKVNQPGNTGPGWSIVSSANSSPNDQNNLTDVACVSGTDCWAWGSHRYNTNADQTLAEHWDGFSWSIVSTPNAGTGDNNLRRVTCVSSNDCWATGGLATSTLGVYQTLAAHWDGNAWTIVSTPNIAGLSNLLEGAACNSSTDCWAIGFSGSGNSLSSSGSYQTLIEHWDGNSWSIVSSPSIGQSSFLGDVTCNSTSDCWAVGGSRFNPWGSLILHWDGNAWSVVSSPTSTANAYLSGITCTSSSQCWAVGFYFSGSGNPFVETGTQTLIERWDGSSWSVVNSVNPGTVYNDFSSVTCPLATSCWAVGRSQNASGSSQKTLIEHWDGNSWSIFSSPNSAAGFNSHLIGVACIDSSQCFSVGQYITNSAAVSQTLIEEYSATIPPLSGAVSRMTHGSAGTFDIGLPVTGTRGVECRTSTALGAGNYSVVFTFANNVTNCGSAATAGGTVVSGPNANQCTMNLTGIADAQTISVELDNVVDAQNNTGNVAVPMGVLIGDASGDGVVNVGDTIVVRNHSGETVSAANCRYDVNADGAINAGDTITVRTHSGDFLP